MRHFTSCKSNVVRKRLKTYLSPMIDSEEKIIEIAKGLYQELAIYNSGRLDKLVLETSINNTIGVYGEDAEELILNFATKYNIDLADFYFPKYFMNEIFSGPYAIYLTFTFPIWIWPYLWHQIRGKSQVPGRRPLHRRIMLIDEYPDFTVWHLIQMAIDGRYSEARPIPRFIKDIDLNLNEWKVISQKS